MKKQIFITFFLLFGLSCLANAQESRLINIVKTPAINCVVMFDEKSIDTIAKFAFDVVLSDYLLSNDTTICFVLEMPLAFFYYSYSNEKGKWIKSLTSGQIASNHKFLSAPDMTLMNRLPIKGSIRIVDEGVIEYTTMHEVITIYARDIKRKNEIWLKQFERNK